MNEGRRDEKVMTIEPYARFWAVYDGKNELVCLCVYRKGALEVVDRLSRKGKEAEEWHLGSNTSTS